MAATPKASCQKNHALTAKHHATGLDQKRNFLTVPFLEE